MPNFEWTPMDKHFNSSQENNTISFILVQLKVMESKSCVILFINHGYKA